MNEELRVCNDCGCVIEGLWDGYNDPDGELICEDCFHETYYECEHCRRIVYQDDIVEINDGDEYVCESCANNYYYECSCCNAYVTDALTLWNNEVVCNHCYNNGYYYTCDNCGNLVHYDDMDDGYCPDCYESHRDVICDHDYKPDCIFLGRNHYYNEPGYYGTELEIDYGDDRRACASEILDVTGGDVYCKYDGSLDRGFEIVTHPATLEYHINNMQWDKIMEICRRYGFLSHDTTTCGLHIHASRTFFGDDKTLQDLNIAKTILLVDKHFDDIIHPFSRRKYHKLDEWARKPDAGINENDNEVMAIRKGNNTENRGRYQAVNLCNWNTVEFRFFRGTLNLETLYASLELIDFIIQYVNHTNLKDVCVNDFKHELNERATGYLKKYLIKRKIIKNNESEEITICV